MCCSSMQFISAPTKSFFHEPCHGPVFELVHRRLPCGAGMVGHRSHAGGADGSNTVGGSACSDPGRHSFELVEGLSRHVELREQCLRP